MICGLCIKVNASGEGSGNPADKIGPGVVYAFVNDHCPSCGDQSTAAAQLLPTVSYVSLLLNTSRSWAIEVKRVLFFFLLSYLASDALDFSWNPQKDGQWEISWQAINCPVGDTKIQYVHENSNEYYIKVQVGRVLLSCTHVHSHLIAYIDKRTQLDLLSTSFASLKLFVLSPEICECR
jgi:hypothetical protein